MNLYRKLKVWIIVLSFAAGCENSKGEQPSDEPTVTFDVKTGEIINNNFAGNGAQWGGYDFIQVYTGSPTLSDTDWNKLKERVEFMRPGVVRIMVSEGWNYNNGYSKSNNILIPVLDFCMENNISVAFGEWGHKGGTSLDMDWLNRSLTFLDWLVNTKKYTCIKYFIMTNEPNGGWSTVAGNYPLWKSIIQESYKMLQEKDLISKVQIMGPDIAYWNLQSAQQYQIWMTNTLSGFPIEITEYDIHAYPGQADLRNGSFTETLNLYKSLTSNNRDISVTELGCKYPDEPSLSNENKRRINEIPYTSSDSNTFVYDAFYAIDMADALIQIMNAGYASGLVWEMDDAMYCAYNSYGAPVALNRWGFWNIVGDEMGITGDENIRPWFYTISLLCRYFPKGSKIYRVESPDKRLQAVACEKDGKFTVAIINHTYSQFKGLNVKFDKQIDATNMKVYQFEASISGSDFTGEVNQKGLPEPLKVESSANLQQGYNLPDMKALSFTLITTIN